jgi:transcription elongation factor SPT5
MSSNLLNHDFGSEDEDDDFNPVAADDSDAEQSKVSSSHPADDKFERGTDKTYNE